MKVYDELINHHSEPIDFMCQYNLKPMFSEELELVNCTKVLGSPPDSISEGMRSLEQVTIGSLLHTLQFKYLSIN